MSEEFQVAELDEEDLIEKEAVKKIEQHILVKLEIEFALLFLVIFSFDIILDIFSTLIDLFIELIHMIIEVIEGSIELGLEHALHTNHQQSEMIIVNSAIVIIIFLVYRLLKALPSIYVGFIRASSKSWHTFAQQTYDHWHVYSMRLKIKLILVYVVGFGGLFLLL